MLHTIQNYRRFVAGLGLATMLTVSMAMPAFAAEVVTTGVTGGDRTASVADMTIPNVDYSHLEQTATSPAMTLSVDDSTGTADGWNVTVDSTDFVHASGVNIPAGNFVLDTPALPAVTAGQAVSLVAGEGPEAGVGGSLDVERKVIKAGIDFGQGAYTQSLGSTLTFPAYSQAGTYTATLTVTISAAPGI